MIFFEIVIRTLVAFFLIMIIARFLGKQTISQMTYHDFVAAITVGALTANLAFNVSLKFWEISFSLITFSIIALALAFVSLKSRKWRKWISGQPTVLIQNGKILENNLKKLRFNLDTLNQELREKDVFDIEEIEYAILELNGKVSVLKKPQYRQVTRKDLSILNTKKTFFPVELIMDGVVVKENLQQNNIKESWLMHELKKYHLPLESVNYAVRGTNGKVFFDFYKDHIQKPIDQE